MTDTPHNLLRRYKISASHGFLPDDTPLRCLPDPYYEPWEALVTDLPRLLSGEQARSRIDELPVLHTERLSLHVQWQRAYVILGFLTHAYIWGGQEPSKRLPPQVVCPFLAVSNYLGLPPTATFSTLSLWNFRSEPVDEQRIRLDNLKSLLSFTGTTDEEWFYMISTAIEANGGPLISTMLHCIEAVDDDDKDAVLCCLQALTSGIRKVGNLLQRMHERCDPQIFYHNIRPLCAGTQGMAAAGLPQGVFYDEGNGHGEWRQYRGGSNAQSSLIQLFDIFLSVDHHATGERQTTQREGAGPRGYLKEMRDYMPPLHREFLSEVERLSNVRKYASRSDVSPEVIAAYNDSVAAVAHLRNIHLQIVARYIVMPSRSPPAPYIISQGGKNLATACSTRKQVGKSDGDVSTTRQLHGTGGTSVMPFLKRTRDETTIATIALHT